MIQIKRGFTLLELLIAISIIALLAAATFTMYDSAKIKSRDSKRTVDMAQIQQGLNLYFTDHSLFPIFPGGVTIDGTDAFSTLLVEGGYMSGVPTDPSPLYSYTYTSNSSGTNYELSFCVEGDSLSGYNQGCDNTISP